MRISNYGDFSKPQKTEVNTKLSHYRDTLTA